MPPEFLPSPPASLGASFPPTAGFLSLPPDVAGTHTPSFLDDLSRHLVSRVRRFLTPLVLVALSLLEACRPSPHSLPETLANRAGEQS